MHTLESLMLLPVSAPVGCLLPALGKGTGPIEQGHSVHLATCLPDHCTSWSHCSNLAGQLNSLVAITGCLCGFLGIGWAVCLVSAASEPDSGSGGLGFPKL